MASTDERLMARVMDGDVAAFGDLFDRHQQPLYAFLVRFTGDRTRAEDATQETFWRVWRHRASFREGPFATWLYAIARNVALTEARRASHAPLLFSSFLRRNSDDDAPTLVEVAAPGDLVEGMAVREQVRRALQSLPAEQRLCVILREYEGRTHEEIAAIIGCSVVNARVLLHRARRTLRKLLSSAREEEANRV